MTSLPRNPLTGRLERAAAGKPDGRRGGEDTVRQSRKSDCPHGDAFADPRGALVFAAIDDDARVGNAAAEGREPAGGAAR
jgi:hypothetical protein